MDQAENLVAALKADRLARSQFRLPGGPKVTTPLRETESAAARHGHHAESVLNLVGARQVGRGSIRGIPILRRLRTDNGTAVWPFDAPSQTGPTLIEVFPRLWLSAAGSKESPPNRVAQLTAWLETGISFEHRTDYLATASADAMDAVGAAVGLAELPGLDTSRLPAEATSREGWIAGVAHAGPPN